MLKKIPLILLIVLLSGCDKTKEINCEKKIEEEKYISPITVKSNVSNGQINDVVIDGTLEYKDSEYFAMVCEEVEDIVCEDTVVKLKNVKEISQEDLDKLKQLKTKQYIEDMEEKGFKCEKK